MGGLALRIDVEANHIPAESLEGPAYETSACEQLEATHLPSTGSDCGPLPAAVDQPREVNTRIW